MGTDIVRLDAATLGAKIAAKELSAVEVTQACLDQIAATDDQLWPQPPATSPFSIARLISRVPG
mgnify:CR=1 FL=1